MTTGKSVVFVYPRAPFEEAENCKFERPAIKLTTSC